MLKFTLKYPIFAPTYSIRLVRPQGVFYWACLKCNFRQAQYKLPEDGQDRPKHVGTIIGYFSVNFNIVYV